MSDPTHFYFAVVIAVLPCFLASATDANKAGAFDQILQANFEIEASSKWNLV